MTPTLGAGELRRALRTALEGLEAHRGQIDDANVYPVPDRDTGTNLVLTVESVVRALEGVPDRPAEVARTVTQAALVGARGNSGVILAQFLRGLCEALDGAGAGPEEASAGLKRASMLAYQALTNPREGTMLTVARAAADAAQGVGDLADLFEGAAAAARVALAHTPDLLPELRRNGVVDAGGIGLCIVLEAIAATVSGRDAEPVPAALVGARAVRPRESGSIEFAYEVQYLLDADIGDAPAIRERLSALGDSVAVVGGDGLLNVHVHTNDVGHAIEIGVEHGRAHSISVTAFEDQIAETQGFPLAMSASPAGVLALVDGDGLRMLFEELGAKTIEADSGAEAISAALESMSVPDVILLACSARAAANAPRAVDAARRNVEVLNTSEPGRGFAALLAYSDSRDFIDNLTEMRTAIATARTLTASSEREVVGAVASLGGAEALTVFTGAGVHDDERERLRETLENTYPSLAAEVRPGGQPGDRYLLVIE